MEILSSYEVFRESAVTKDLLNYYDKNVPLFRFACLRLCRDLNISPGVLGLFTSIEGRVKSKDSLFRKLYDISTECANKGETVKEDNIRDLFNDILDISGIRLACRYPDEIKETVGLARKALEVKGYEVDLQSQKEIFSDEDYIRKPNPKNGYRGYHFYVRVPLDPLLPGVPGIVCEIQIRSELQDIWARRSHELLYKKHGRFPEEKIEYMKHMSDFLKTVDNFLITIRDEVTTT